MLVIGEAASRIPSAVQSKYPSLRWDEMRAMRNILAHGYFEVKDEFVRDTIEKDLPGVIPVLRQIVAAEASSSSP